jgi:response regulator of citrate/malate metabolism
MRLLTPLGLKYESAVERYKPYDRIVQPQQRMRQETIELVKRAATEGKSAYVLVNNRSEGCSPLTVQAIVEALTQHPSAQP